jgi:hypothetical protein
MICFIHLRQMRPTAQFRLVDDPVLPAIENSKNFIASSLDTPAKAVSFRPSRSVTP